MAFELYLGEECVFIEHHEEGVFELANDATQFPQLNWVWDRFYSDPVVSPAVANNLVHELIILRQKLSLEADYKYLLRTIDKVLPLLSKAYINDEVIKCSSD